MTLIEVLVAAAILAVGLSALATSIPVVLRVIADVRELSVADRIASASTEQLVMTWAASPARVPATDTVVVDDSGREDPAGRFSVSWTLTPDRPIDGNTALAVTVVWRAPDGRARSRVLRTYVAGVQ